MPTSSFARGRRRLLAPSRTARAITDLSVEELSRSGVRCVLVDRDNTCVPRDTGQAPREVLEWLAAARAAGMKTCMVSNNFHSREVEASAAELGCDVVHHAMKPAPFAVRRALAIAGCAPEEAVLVGDQVFTDVVAGNLAGVNTVLVDPQSSSDLWYTHVFRVFERLVAGRGATGSTGSGAEGAGRPGQAGSGAEGAGRADSMGSGAEGTDRAGRADSAVEGAGRPGPTGPGAA